MLRILGLRASPMRLLGIAAAATLMLSAGTTRPAEAMNPINPRALPAAKAASGDVIPAFQAGGGFGGGRNGLGVPRGGGLPCGRGRVSWLLPRGLHPAGGFRAVTLS